MVQLTTYFIYQDSIQNMAKKQSQSYVVVKITYIYTYHQTKEVSINNKVFGHHIVNIFNILISDDIHVQPSTVVSDQRLCESSCGYWNYWMQSAIERKYCKQGHS